MIKSTHKAINKRCSRPFPKLMISKDEEGEKIIILATSGGDYTINGNIVYSDNSTLDIGYYCECWVSGSFEDYIGEVVLKEC
jgi:hypothetical protein